jgi:hypothetical protein
MSIKVSKRLKRVLMISFSGLYSAGTAYWFSQKFLRKIGEFGEEPHVLERFLGPLHLIAALLFIFVMGIIWARHVGTAIRLHRHRLSGWLFFACLGMLALSGITIVYAGEGLSKIVEQIHPWIGISLLPILIYHWRYRNKSSVRSEADKINLKTFGKIFESK